MADETVKQIIADYYRDFSSLNVQTILTYFNEPSLLVGPQGVIPAPGHRSVEAVFGPVMEGLRAKGYGRSEFEPAYIKTLSSSVAIMIGTAVRYKADGGELERAGVSYVLHKTANGWKFATMMLHDPVAP
jgi:ketosteroid isomerase-like protein